MIEVKTTCPVAIKLERQNGHKGCLRYVLNPMAFVWALLQGGTLTFRGIADHLGLDQKQPGESKTSISKTLQEMTTARVVTLSQRTRAHLCEYSLPQALIEYLKGKDISQIEYRDLVYFMSDPTVARLR